MTIAIVKSSIVIIAAAAAATTDVKWGKIPNLLTVPVIVLGIVLNAASLGSAGVIASLAGIAVALALWIATLAIGGVLGGGDIKLLAALGALRGPQFLTYVFMVSVAVGGLLAIAVALRRRALVASLRRLGQGLMSVAIPQVPTHAGGATDSICFPYAAAIAVGAATTLLYLGI